jgi:hypothetical protein
MTFPAGIDIIYQNVGPIPPGSFLEPRDGYSLLRFRSTTLVDTVPILGFLLDPTRQILGVATGAQDADPNHPASDCAILHPNGAVSQGPKTWPNADAWIAEMANR